MEFEVKTGPFPGDRRRCKLSCVAGQWVGPLCRKDEGKQKHGIVNKIRSKMRKLGDPYFLSVKNNINEKGAGDIKVRTTK